MYTNIRNIEYFTKIRSLARCLAVSRNIEILYILKITSKYYFTTWYPTEQYLTHTQLISVSYMHVWSSNGDLGKVLPVDVTFL